MADGDSPTESPAGNRKELGGYVGFANLPNQVHRKSVKKGFEFCLMVVGESGLGKSTLVNSLFLTDLYTEREYLPAADRIKKTVDVSATTVEFEEKGVRLRLTVVDTPGYGDAVNNDDAWVPIENYINAQYEQYLNDEFRVNRTKIVDNRVHCCLYFLSPTGHGLKPIDVEFMKRLAKRVNIVPVIAKSDTLTPEEVKAMKEKILEDIEKHNIAIYQFQIDSEDDEDTVKECQDLQASVPFAVVGSNTVIEVGGKKIRGRQYPWGVVEIENDQHSDFNKLRNMLIRSHMQDLKDSTNDIHYENFRSTKLAQMSNLGQSDADRNINPMDKFEEEKKEHEKKMNKMEEEMRSVFTLKVKEKEQKLKESEKELMVKHEELQKQLEQQKRELEERQRAFEEERKQYEAQGDKKKDKKGSKIF